MAKVENSTESIWSTITKHSRSALTATLVSSAVIGGNVVHSEADLAAKEECVINVHYLDPTKDPLFDWDYQRTIQCDDNYLLFVMPDQGIIDLKRLLKPAIAGGVIILLIAGLLHLKSRIPHW